MQQWCRHDRRNHGNQIQPLLLSDQGDVVWSDQPFRIRVGRAVRVNAGLDVLPVFERVSP